MSSRLRCLLSTAEIGKLNLPSLHYIYSIKFDKKVIVILSIFTIFSYLKHLCLSNNNLKNVALKVFLIISI